MDENKKEKFKIEFDDDFDAWLADYEKAKQNEQPAQQKASVSSPQTKPSEPVPVKKAESAPSERFKPVDSATPSDIRVNRSNAVKNFKIQIDEEEYNKPAYEEPAKPAKRDKAVYFAGRKPTKAQIEHRNAQEKARVDRQKKERQAIAAQRVKEKDQITKLRQILLIAVIVICSVAFSSYGISCINDILALSRDDELVVVTIENDYGYNEIINELKKNGLIKHKWFCKIITKFRGFDDESYLHGNHYLTADMGVEGMLTAMLEDQKSDKTIRLSFPEGWTIPQIIAKLDENNVCPAAYIYDALKSVEFEYNFINDIPIDSEKCYLLEGYVFPDTYDFFVSEKENGIGENPTSIINKFLGNFESKWSEVYVQRAKEMGLTMDEVITIASIIQKEAADKSQMGKVSSVIHNRLNNPSAYPTLGCDSTKKYVNNYLAPVLGSAGASSFLNGYDTNSTRSGLPAGPICNPGVDAIEAALNPDDTDYYYFCHNEAGKIYMAKTYSEFQANWAQVLRDNKE